MAKGFRETLLESLKDVGLTPQVIKRLVPKRGSKWNRISEKFDDLVLLIAHKVRQQLEDGATIKPRLIFKAMKQIRGDEELPEYSELENLDCSEDEDSLNIPKRRRISREGPKPPETAAVAEESLSLPEEVLARKPSSPTVIENLVPPVEEPTIPAEERAIPEDDPGEGPSYLVYTSTKRRKKHKRRT